MIPAFRIVKGFSPRRFDFLLPGQQWDAMQI
jgi:hypothetical protein